MTPVLTFKLIILSLVAILCLELLAQRLRLPSAAALLIGGIAMAFVPGLPRVELDPELVILIFLPPLLMDGAYYIVWDEFRRNLTGILLLAIGAVAFTTLVVGYVAHLVVPGLPLGACFALGAIVSPPDAIAAKGVLERVALPRRVMVLLEGESMLNDASGLVLLRFGIAAALTGAFSLPHALGEFTMLCLGGIAIGGMIGYIVIKLLKYVADAYFIIIATALTGWICYIVGEAVEVSGVLATVTYGMMLGWHQHEVISATVRTRGTAFWQLMTFLLESLVFMLIGLSLRSVIERVGGAGAVFAEYGLAVGVIVAAVVLSRFAWVFVMDCLPPVLGMLLRRGPAAVGWRAATIKSWAGMRGVVTLAAALALPATMPGRDLILVASFAVIVATVLLQGTTIGPLIRLLRLDGKEERQVHHLSEPQAWARVEAAQFAAVETAAYDPNGKLVHPRLLEQYGYRARLSCEHQHEPELPADVRASHYDVVLAGIAAGRGELLRLHRSGQLHDDLLHLLEHDLDLQELSAIHGRGG